MDDRRHTRRQHTHKHTWCYAVVGLARIQTPSCLPNMIAASSHVPNVRPYVPNGVDVCTRRVCRGLLIFVVRVCVFFLMGLLEKFRVCVCCFFVSEDLCTDSFIFETSIVFLGCVCARVISGDDFGVDVVVYNAYVICYECSNILCIYPIKVCVFVCMSFIV